MTRDATSGRGAIPKPMSVITSATNVQASRGVNPMRWQGILTTQKRRTDCRYTVGDPLVGDLLDVARRIFNNQLTGTRGLLRELRREGIMKGMKRVKGMKR